MCYLDYHLHRIRLHFARHKRIASLKPMKLWNYSFQGALSRTKTLINWYSPWTKIFSNWWSCVHRTHCHINYQFHCSIYEGMNKYWVSDTKEFRYFLLEKMLNWIGGCNWNTRRSGALHPLDDSALHRNKPHTHKSVFLFEIVHDCRKLDTNPAFQHTYHPKSHALLNNIQLMHYSKP